MKNPHGYGGKLLVPCGQCPLCKHTNRMQWVYRMEQEAKVSDISQMLTLTYDDEHIKFGNLAPSLDDSDIHTFNRKLKKYLRLRGISYRYYGKGEYGDVTLRPHYHLMVFFRIQNYNAKDYLYWLDYLWQAIDKFWLEGHFQMDECSFGTMYYLAKYATKGLGNTPYGSAEPRTVCSKHPAIGGDYIRTNGAWHRKAPRVRTAREDYTVTARRYMYSGRYKIGLPRIYRRALYGDRKLNAYEFDLLVRLQQNERLTKYFRNKAHFQKSRPSQDYDDRLCKEIEIYLEQLERKLKQFKDDY